jgi:hypothetical protein
MTEEEYKYRIARIDERDRIHKILMATASEMLEKAETRLDRFFGFGANKYLYAAKIIGELHDEILGDKS